MEQLWAPWRMQYISKADDVEGCIFCVFPAENRDDERLILLRGEKAYIILNAFPYSNGHLMVTPYRHTADLNDLTDEEMLEMMALTRRGVNLLKAAFRPDGFNIGMNMGRVAGAGIADHVHIHIVPRWSGDTNFMPVLGDVRVIPESLNAVYSRLKQVRGGRQGLGGLATCLTWNPRKNRRKLSSPESGKQPRFVRSATSPQRAITWYSAKAIQKLHWFLWVRGQARTRMQRVVHLWAGPAFCWMNVSVKTG
jgi:ATP adenylyltransferase